MIERINLRPDYNISRIIKGGWHLAGGHGRIGEREAIDDMLRFVEAGITTFDCADIYTGVEELIGKFLQKHKDAIRHGTLPSVQIHTKYVPDYSALGKLKKADTEKIIDRSLMRLGVEQLDLVQFAWWDYSKPAYVETAQHLAALQAAGKIRYIGTTNFDAARIAEIAGGNVPLVSRQVQYSLLDQRPEGDQPELMEKHQLHYLCYGVIAGGFLSNRYLNAPDPSQPLENRSLTKYRLIIDEFGGYALFQDLLKVLDKIGQKYGVGIAEVAARFILDKPRVGAVIIGARNSKHLAKLLKLQSFSLEEEDLAAIQAVLEQTAGPAGPVYELERDKTGKHGAIMKYNLNGQ